MRFSLDIRPSAKLRRNLNARHLFGAPAHEFLTEATRAIREQSFAEAPADEGDLRKAHKAHIDSRPLPSWGEMRVEAKHGIYVHEGTRPHWAPVAALQGWADRHNINVYALQRAIARKGTKPNPWLARAEPAFTARIRRLTVGFAVDIQRRWSK